LADIQHHERPGRTTSRRLPGQRKFAEALERIVSLYEAWHEPEPDQGYDAKAAEWRAKLPPEATSQPAE
jgi:hypothetical protein